MLHLITRFFQPSHEIQHAYALYAHINGEARKPMFFSDWQVPDTLDGRFELILLHMFIYLHSMKAHMDDTTRAQRQLIEAFFEDMDRSVREIGVSDTGVGKRIKAMANAFYGRVHAFESSLDDDEKLAERIKANLYGTAENAPDSVQPVIGYLRSELARLEGEPLHQPAWLDAQLAKHAS